MARLILEELTKVYPTSRRESLTAVDRLSLEVGRHELLVLLGPSGSGKTTTLRVVAGLEPATSGTIRLGERPIDRLRPKDRDVAMVFQTSALFPHLDVYENIALGLRLRNRPKAVIRESVHSAAEWLGVTPHLQRYPSALSGGERQRVALARAWVREPEVFLLDEPLSHLDAPMRLRLRREIGRLQRDLGTAMVYVTHDQTEGLALGDRIAVLNRGRLQQIAAPTELYRRPANRFVAEFVGAPPMNFFQGRLSAMEGRVRFCPDGDVDEIGKGDSFEVALPADRLTRLAAYVEEALPVTIGWRPEDLRLKKPEGEAAEQSAGLPAVLQWRETMGPDTYLHFTVAGQQAIARLDGQLEAPEPGKMTVWAPMPKAHFFDPASGNALE